MSAAVEPAGLRRPVQGDAGTARPAVAVADTSRARGIALLESEVRELVRRRDIDPMAEPERFAELVQEAAADYADRAARGVVAQLPDLESVIREVHNAVGGLGPLQLFLDDPDIEEIGVNSPSRAANLLPGWSEAVRAFGPTGVSRTTGSALR